jgi:hypothetical protein
VSPYGTIARSFVGAGLGAAQEYFTNPNATTQDVIRNATLMAGFAALAAKKGLPLEETVAGTIFDWAKNKGYTPEELSRALQIQGIGPVFNEFAEDMTAPQMGNRSGVDLALKHKPGWTATQQAEATAKAQTLNDSETSVTQVDRTGSSATRRYRQAKGVIPEGSDVDHVVDLQLGGADTLSNMRPLNSSVNRSLGAQIQQQIKDLPAGTRINRVKIGE